jgi:predicted nuclease with TOPRIM domain
MSANELEILKLIVSAGGGSGLAGIIVWKLVMRALDTFTRQQEEINRLHTKNTEDAVKRASRLETKLDDCEKKHDEMNRQMSHLREEHGMLKGKVETMGLFTSNQIAPKPKE